MKAQWEPWLDAILAHAKKYANNSGEHLSNISGKTTIFISGDKYLFNKYNKSENNIVYFRCQSYINDCDVKAQANELDPLQSLVIKNT